MAIGFIFANYCWTLLFYLRFYKVFLISPISLKILSKSVEPILKNYLFHNSANTKDFYITPSLQSSTLCIPLLKNFLMISYSIWSILMTDFLIFLLLHSNCDWLDISHFLLFVWVLKSYIRSKFNQSRCSNLENHNFILLFWQLLLKL